MFKIMSTNCLVTKLEGKVVNENLTIFGKVVIKLKKIASATGAEKWFFLRAGHKDCNVQFINTALGSNPSNITVLAGQTLSGSLDLTQDNASIIINAYDFVALAVASASDYIGLDSCKSGDCAALAIPYDKADILKSFTQLKGISVLVGDNVPPVDLSEVIHNNPQLLFVTGNVSSIPVSVLPENSQIQSIALYGDIATFPKTLKSVYVDSKIIGSVTAWVEACRAAGRTSGKIKSSLLGANDNITIDDGNGNEISAKTYRESKGIPLGEQIYLVWTEDSIDITADSTGAETPINITTITV